MRFAGNVIWFLLGGAVTALLWLIGAVVFAITIIGLPLTRSAIEMAKLSAFPFGKDVVHIRELDGRDDPTTAVTGASASSSTLCGQLRSGWHCSSPTSLLASLGA